MVELVADYAALLQARAHARALLDARLTAAPLISAHISANISQDLAELEDRATRASTAGPDAAAAAAAALPATPVVSGAAAAAAIAAAAAAAAPGPWSREVKLSLESELIAASAPPVRHVRQTARGEIQVNALLPTH